MADSHERLLRTVQLRLLVNLSVTVRSNMTWHMSGARLQAGG
jgi:hypothetical protein